MVSTADQKPWEGFGGVGLRHLEKSRKIKSGKRRVRTPPTKYAPWDIRTVGRRPRLTESNIVSTLVSLRVRGETPEEAAQDVAHPEEGVDQHGLVVLRAHPIVLWQT